MHLKLETCSPYYFSFFLKSNILHQNRGPIVKWKQRHNQSTSVKSKLLQGIYKYKADTFDCLAWN